MRKGKSDAARVLAADKILDRGCGKPQAHTGTNPDGPINFVLRHIVEAMPPKKDPAALENAPRSTPGPPLAHLRPVSGGGGG
jgi:hypothetical protein